MRFLLNITNHECSSFLQLIINNMKGTFWGKIVYGAYFSWFCYKITCINDCTKYM